jgi:transmembrane sensor
MAIPSSHINGFDELLRKFHEGNISSEEYARLSKAMKATSDFELHKMLEEHWETFEEYEELAEDKIDLLYNKGIKPQLHISEEHSIGIRLKRYWLQIAASLLVLIMGGLAVKFYTESRVVYQLAERQITIDAGESGISAVTLPDGTKVRLNAKSTLSYRQDFGQKDRRVSLSGEGYFEVKRDEAKRFVVTTEVMDIAVLGTSFNVFAYANKDFVEMSLVEGHVQVSPFNNVNRIVDVRPNEKVTYYKATGKLDLTRTSNRLETAWLSNELAFRHDKLKEVFSCLERKFGVVFRGGTQELFEDVYTGTFEEENLETILRVLQIHYGFKYHLEDNTVYLNID